MQGIWLWTHRFPSFEAKIVPTKDDAAKEYH